MNSTFKVAQSGYQLNIVPYTGPPPPKPKRLQAPPRREQIVEEYSLPDLPPDSVFDHVVDGPSPDRDADCDLTASVNVVRGGSVPPAQDFGGTEIDLPVEMRVHDLSCEAVQIQLPSPVLAPKPDLASRGLRKSPPAKKIHITKTKQAVDSRDVDEENPTRDGTAFAQSPQWNADRKDHGFGPNPEDEGPVDEDPMDEHFPKAHPANENHGSGSHGSKKPGRKQPEPETPFYHVTPSDSDISNFEFTTLVGQARLQGRKEGALQSVKPRLETVVPNRHVPFGQSNPKSILLSRASSKVKVPHSRPGSRTRALSEIESPLPKRKRGHSTMGRSITKRRSWQTSQATASAGMSHSDSDSSHDDTSNVDTAADVRKRPRARQLPKMSKARTASKWKERRGNHASSASIGSRLKANPQGRDSRALPQSSDVFHGNGASAAYSTLALPKCDIHAATSTQSTVLTGLLTDIANIEPLLKSSAAWGLADNPSSTRLVSATIKPHTSEQWQLTVTFARVPRVEETLSDLSICVRADGPSADDNSSILSSIHHESSEDESVNRSQSIRRGAWEKDEDNKLVGWRLRGESWPWILKQFPHRTEGAVKSRWYVVLAPQQRSGKGRER